MAPGATILPIRVLGWMRDATGAFQVVGRSDLLLAGLERAVDPNEDGDTVDAAPIALAALSEPYAAFADGPEARAVAGAGRLGTLVVAAAGNDGPGSGSFGTIGAPGGAPDALTVGAADLRRQVMTARVSVAVGGNQLFDGVSRVLGEAAPSRQLDVAGQDVTAIPADETPVVPRVRSSVARGAEAVLVYGSALPASSLDLEEGATVPVVTVPSRSAERLPLLGRAAQRSRSRSAQQSRSRTPISDGSRRSRLVGPSSTGNSSRSSSRRVSASRPSTRERAPRASRATRP